MRVRYLLAASILLLMSTQTIAQSAYRWVDKNGHVHYSDQPPPQEIKNVEQRRIGAGNTIDTTGLPFETQKAAKDFPVTLYTASDCTVECQVAREFLAKRGVPYRESVINSPEDAETYRKVFNTDKLFLPAIVVGTQKQRGYSEGGWNALLDAARYSRTAIPGAAPKPAAPVKPATDADGESEQSAQ